jgi:cytidine deaminase
MTGVVPLTQLSAVYQAAAKAAVTVSKNSYSPYSKFCVGAALVHPDGAFTLGCNWENAVYNAVCAERTAICAANAQGRRQATAVAVYGVPLGFKIAPGDKTLVTPCGICRQMLNETSQLTKVDLDVILVARNATHGKVVKLSTLLPDSFGPVDLGISLDEYAQGSNDPKATGAAALPKKAASPAAAAPKKSPAKKAAGKKK